MPSVEVTIPVYVGIERGWLSPGSGPVEVSQEEAELAASVDPKAVVVQKRGPGRPRSTPQSTEQE